MAGIDEAIKKAEANRKTQEVGAIRASVGTGYDRPEEPSFDDRKASLLRRVDWAEGQLLRQILRLREAREVLQHANYNTVQVVEILLSLDTDLLKY